MVRVCLGAGQDATLKGGGTIMLILVQSPLGHKRPDTSSATEEWQQLGQTRRHKMVGIIGTNEDSVSGLNHPGLLGRGKPCLHQFCLLFVLIAHNCLIRSLMSTFFPSVKRKMDRLFPSPDFYSSEHAKIRPHLTIFSAPNFLA